MKVTKKMKRFAALLIAAVVMLSGVPLPSVQAAGDAKVPFFFVLFPIGTTIALP